MFEAQLFLEGAAFVSILILCGNLLVKCAVYVIKKIIKERAENNDLNTIPV
jgi:hypothetical protein